jgi:hypothetical protein
MHNPADSIPPGDTESPVENIPGDSASPAADAWELARQRVLLYLRALNVPAENSSALAAEILQRAEQARGQSPDTHPAALAMQALHCLFSQQMTSVLPDSADTRSLSRNVHGIPSDIESMPPLNRSLMFPVEIDRNPWYTIFAKKILRRK